MQPVFFPLAIRNMHPVFHGLQRKALPGIANHPPHGRPLLPRAIVGRHPLPRSLVRQYLSKGLTPLTFLLNLTHQIFTTRRCPWSSSSTRLSARPLHFDQSYLAPRPKDWRKDYQVHTGLSSIFPCRTRRWSSSAHDEVYDTTNHTLHTFLQYDSANPPFIVNLRTDLSAIKSNSLGRSFNYHDLRQYACDPPAEFMRLYHFKLPWYIDVRASQPSGVTIAEILDQMHKALMIQIREKHLYNEELDDGDRAKISQAFRDRCILDTRNQLTGGVRRVDFLTKHLLWEGLAGGKNGMWEIKTRTLS